MKKTQFEHPILWVCIFMLLTLLPVLACRDYTPSNELRYLNIVDEAIANGKLFAFSCNGEPYADKPPFYFWLMMLCRVICGRHCILVLSLLSFIPSCIVVAVMDKWFRSYTVTNTGSRLAAAMMTETCALFLGMSIIVRMDMLMIMWIILSLWTFWRMDHGGGKLLTLLLPFYIFMGLFTKGPIGLLMPVTCICAYLILSHRTREIGRFLGVKTWGVLLLLSTAWLYGAWMDGGTSYLKNLLFHQTLDRAVNAFTHKQPFWYYGKVIWGILAPWCLTLAPVLLLSLSTWHKQVSNLERFFGVSAVSCIIMLSFFSSKLAVYLGPMIPFTVYLMPLYFKRSGWHKWMEVTLSAAFAILFISGTALASSAIMSRIGLHFSILEKYPFLCSLPAIPAGLVLAAGSFLAVRKIRNQDWTGPVICTSVSLMLAVLVMSISIDSINDFLGYRNLCSLVPEDVQVYTFRVKRAENMDFYLGRGITDFGEDAKSFLEIAPSEGVLLVKNSALKDHPDLSDYLSGKQSVCCGKYSAYYLMNHHLTEGIPESDCGTE